jgi:hypothetical protein
MDRRVFAADALGVPGAAGATSNLRRRMRLMEGRDRAREKPSLKTHAFLS